MSGHDIAIEIVSSDYVKKISAGWRYQPVYVEEGDEFIVSLCEVYFDNDGKLSAWTEDAEMSPSGSSIDELSRDLVHMLSDAYKWRPVRFSDLRPGMTFERAIPQDEAERLADFIEATADIHKRANSKGAA